MSAVRSKICGITRIEDALAAVEAESFAVTARINNMSVKTMRQDADKIPVIQKMISESVDIPTLLKSL